MAALGRLSKSSPLLASLLMVAILMEYGGRSQAASVGGVWRRQVDLEHSQAEMKALDGLNLGLRAARKLSRKLIPLPEIYDSALEGNATDTLEALVEAMELRDLMEEMLKSNTSAEIVALHAVVEAVVNETCGWVQHLERFANLTCSREEQLELRVRFRLYQLMNSAESTSSKYTRALHLATNIPVEKIDTVRESRWLEENVLCIPPSAQAVISSNYLTQDKPSFSCTSNSAAY